MTPTPDLFLRLPYIIACTESVFAPIMVLDDLEYFEAKIQLIWTAYPYFVNYLRFQVIAAWAIFGLRTPSFMAFRIWNIFPHHTNTPNSRMSVCFKSSLHKASMPYHDSLARDQALRLLGLFYIEDSSKVEQEKDPRVKKQLDAAIKESIETLRRLYQDAKGNGVLKEDPMLARTGKMIDEALGKRDTDQIEKAKRLLESKGYTVR